MMSMRLARSSHAQACPWIKHNGTIVTGQGPLNCRGGRLARTDVYIEAASHLWLDKPDHAQLTRALSTIMNLKSDNRHRSNLRAFE